MSLAGSQRHQNIVIALAKGRTLDASIERLGTAGIFPSEDVHQSRKLRLSTNVEHLRLLLVRNADAPVYVREGAADVGIVGNDLLLEQGRAALGEYADLGISRCRLCIAAAGKKTLDPKMKIRVATKYVNICQQWFAERGQPIEIIKLYGSMELAPLLGIADFIVDLVSTGNTLKANGLEVVEEMYAISSRLIYNPISWKIKSTILKQTLECICRGNA